MAFSSEGIWFLPASVGTAVFAWQGFVLDSQPRRVVLWLGLSAGCVV